MDEADAVAAMFDDFWWGFWTEKAKESGPESAGRNPKRDNEVIVLAEEAARILQLDRSHTLVEVGCGTGEMTAHLQPRVALLIGVDPIPQMVERCRHRFPSTSRAFVQGDIRALPNDWEPDRILVGSVLQYIDRDELMTAMRSVYECIGSRYGGAVLFQAIPNAEHRDQYLKDCPAESRDANEKATWYHPWEVRAAASAAGFLATQELPVSPLLWQSSYMFDVLAVKTP